MQKSLLSKLIVCVGALLVGCSDTTTPTDAINQTSTTDTPSAEPSAEASETPAARFGGAQLEMPADIIIANPSANAHRSAYIGDLHVHSTYTFHAYAYGPLATPYDANR